MTIARLMIRVKIWLEDAGCDKNAQQHYSDDDGDLSNGQLDGEDNNDGGYDGYGYDVIDSCQIGSGKVYEDQRKMIITGVTMMTG